MSSSWGKKRRNSILLVIFILILAPIILWIFVFKYEKPTCFDFKKNGTELGIDCGGGCSLLCAGQSIPPYVKWQRFFPVNVGIYNAMAYVENQNASAGTTFNYKFTLYDAENAILSTREGKVNLHAKQALPIAANIMNTGKLIATRVQFEIVGVPIWVTENQQAVEILISDETLLEEDGQTFVKAKLSNVSFGDINEVSAIVILYDRDDNAIGVSSTFVEKIAANESKQIIFTWPRLYGNTVQKFEVIPVYESN